jgi:hypothetical protein
MQYNSKSISGSSAGFHFRRLIELLEAMVRAFFTKPTNFSKSMQPTFKQGKKNSFIDS